MVIGLGFTLFFSGLIGWVGGASESPCLVRLFLFSVVVSMVAEIGGIISLNIVRLQVCILTYLGAIHILRTYLKGGGESESTCLVRLFLFSVVVSMIAEIGGIHLLRDHSYITSE